MRVLIISANWSGLVTPIVEEIRKQGHEVDYLDYDFLVDFKYFNFFDRIQSKLFNVLYTEAYKNIRVDEQIECCLRGFFYNRPHYDLTVLTNPSFFNDTHFGYIKNNSKRLVLNLWDSLDKMPGNQSKIEYFDAIRSFDPIDCERYGFIPTTNYFQS